MGCKLMQDCRIFHDVYHDSCNYFKSVLHWCLAKVTAKKYNYILRQNETQIYIFMIVFSKIQKQTNIKFKTNIDFLKAKTL